MFPTNDPRVAQLLKNPQYFNLLSKMQGNPFVGGVGGPQATLIHHPTAGTSISNPTSHIPPNAMALMAAQVLQQANLSQSAIGVGSNLQSSSSLQNSSNNSTNGIRILPVGATTGSNLIPNNGGVGVPPGGVPTTTTTTASKWHDDLSRNTRQELFNAIVEIKTGKPFSGDKSTIDSNLSKSILNQISKIWKQTNSKEQFAQELSQWLALENQTIPALEVEKKLLELMNKPQKPPVENLFGMMATAASSIGTNNSFPNITNTINAKNPTGTGSSGSSGVGVPPPSLPVNGISGISNPNTTTTSTAAVNNGANNNSNTNVVTTTTNAPPVSTTTNTNGNSAGAGGPNLQTVKKLSMAEIEQYLGFVDFLKLHEDMIRQYIKTVAIQHADFTKRMKTITSMTPEDQHRTKLNHQKNQMILAESKALEKLLSLSTREDRLKHMENFTQKSYAFAVHIREIIEKKLKSRETQPPTVAQPPPPLPTVTTASTASATTTNTSTAIGSSSGTTGNTSTTNTSSSSIPTGSTVSSVTQPPTPQQAINSSNATQSTSTSSTTTTAVQPPQTHKKETTDDGFYNLKKIGESSIITFNQDSFYSALGEMNIKSLTQPTSSTTTTTTTAATTTTTTTPTATTKRKLAESTSTEHEKVLKRIKTPIDILQNNLTNLIEFDNIIEFKNTINIKIIEDARYQLDFIINPKEKGILNLPILSLCVIVNHNEIIPYSISFSHNYANEKNSVFVHIRKYFNNLLIENTTSFINTNDMLSTHNNTYHIQRYNLSLNCILNSWITSINTVVKKELQ